MDNKLSRRILFVYNLLLAIGAIWCGTIMMTGGLGEYPTEWLEKIPFTNWVLPGIIAIVVYGFGNLLAAILSLNKNNKGIIISIIMGLLLLISMLISIKVLGKVYLPTIEFIIISMIQLVISVFSFINGHVRY